MIEGRCVLPSDRKPYVLEYNRGGIAAPPRRPINIFAVITAMIPVVVLGAKVLDKFTSRSACGGIQQVECRAGFFPLEMSLDSFYADTGRYPTEKEGLSALLDPPPGMESRWHGPYIKPREVRDPWGRPYRYHRGSRAHNEDYWLVSCGPDGIEGTADDVTNY